MPSTILARLSQDQFLSDSYKTQVYEFDANSIAVSNIKKAIEFKSLIEAAGRNWHGFQDKLLMQSMGIPEPNSQSARLAIDPGKFVEAILGPFIEEPDDCHVMSMASIDSQLVVGAPWRGHDQVSRPEALALIANFDACTLKSDTRSGSNGTWYRPFPLVAAGEGKNRISMYVHHNISHILTRISPINIICADRLRLDNYCNKYWILRVDKFSDRPGDLNKPFRLSARSYMLPFPKFSVPILKAYGVREIRRHWLFGKERKFTHHMRLFLTESFIERGTSPWATGRGAP